MQRGQQQGQMYYFYPISEFGRGYKRITYMRLINRLCTGMDVSTFRLKSPKMILISEMV
jgi:hypothetical protein